MRFMLGATAVMLVLAGCSKAPEQAAEQGQQQAGGATPADAASGFHTEMPLKEFMGHVMQYSAEGIWSRQGYVIDQSGERSLFPTTTEEWEKAESAGLTLAELSNVLLLPGRKVDDGKWVEWTNKVRSVALEAARAAEKQDENGFFDAGGRLDMACEGCHEVYAPWAVRGGPKS